MTDYSRLKILESPVYQGAGASIPWTVVFPWATTVSAATVTAYKDGTDVTSTVLSGDQTLSGNRLTMKTLGSLTGGEKYTLSIVATVDGVADQWFLEVWAVKSTTGAVD
jgi:hypothetical protein